MLCFHERRLHSTTHPHPILAPLPPRRAPLPAAAVLVFAVLESKMSQPRNFLGGQLLSALVGITTRVVIHQVWIAGPVGMSLALVLMQCTSTTHPPGKPGAHAAAPRRTAHALTWSSQYQQCVLASS